MLVDGKLKTERRLCRGAPHFRFGVLVFDPRWAELSALARGAAAGHKDDPTPRFDCGHRTPSLNDDAAAAVTWPAWEGVQQSVLVLQTPSSGGIRVVPRLREELCEFWATIPDRFVPIT